jgi:hypothetical protein
MFLGTRGADLVRQMEAELQKNLMPSGKNTEDGLACLDDIDVEDPSHCVVHEIHEKKKQEKVREARQKAKERIASKMLKDQQAHEMKEIQKKQKHDRLMQKLHPLERYMPDWKEVQVEQKDRWGRSKTKREEERPKRWKMSSKEREQRRQEMITQMRAEAAEKDAREREARDKKKQAQNQEIKQSKPISQTSRHVGHQASRAGENEAKTPADVENKNEQQHNNPVPTIRDSNTPDIVSGEYVHDSGASEGPLPLALADNPEPLADEDAMPMPSMPTRQTTHADTYVERNTEASKKSNERRERRRRHKAKIQQKQSSMNAIFDTLGI